MTAHYGAGVLPEKMSATILANPESADCLIPMGITSENVAKAYNITRDTQDAFAANSFNKASKAQKSYLSRSTGPTQKLVTRRKLSSMKMMESETESQRKV